MSNKDEHINQLLEKIKFLEPHIDELSSLLKHSECKKIINGNLNLLLHKMAHCTIIYKTIILPEKTTLN